MTDANADYDRDAQFMKREPDENPEHAVEWAGTDFTVDSAKYQAAADFLRACDLTPTADAIEQLADAFLPCLQIICERGYANDGSTWEAGGWRGLLHELIKKIHRVQFFDWHRNMPDKALREIPDVINYAGMYFRSRQEIDAWGTLFGEPGNWGAANIPQIVTLCGSTRFAHLFHKVNLQETIKGRIVLSIGWDAHSDADLAALDGMGFDAAGVKPALDELHKRKIDLSSYIIVISDESGYIGDSTRSEIQYALLKGKPIEWLEDAAERRFYK